MFLGFRVSRELHYQIDLSCCSNALPTCCDVQPFLFVSCQEEMENKAMYLSTYEERENGSVYEEAYDGHNLSKLSLCDEGEEVARAQILI